MCAFMDFSETRLAARKKLPKAIFDYIDRGTEAETAINGLRAAFDRRRIVQRTLRNLQNIDLSVEVLGKTRIHPLLIAPTALAGLVRYNGEIEIARGAAEANIPYCASTQASTKIEDIVAGAHNSEIWFQLYPWQDQEATFKLIDRVRDLGIKTLVVTVDTPGSPKKVHNLRNGFSIPLKPSAKLAFDLMMHPQWTLGVVGRYWFNQGFPSYDNYPGDARAAITRSVSDPRYAMVKNFEPAAISAIRDHWKDILVIKGIQHPDDAELAINLGVQGVVVSAHGGRNIDSLAFPLIVLPAIRQKIGGKATIFADSGIQRGSDIAKLMGAGADAVFAGRSFLWALASAGQAGIPRMTNILLDELKTFMAFAGMENINSLQSAKWIDDNF